MRGPAFRRLRERACRLFAVLDRSALLFALILSLTVIFGGRATLILLEPHPTPTTTRPWKILLQKVGVENDGHLTDVPLQHQLRQLTWDAQLYYGLARNLVDKRGYYDTVRNQEIMPSIGHPLILALVCVRGGFTPAELSAISLWLTVGLVAIAVWTYGRSNLLVGAGVLLFTGYLAKMRWLAGNVEASIALGGGLLVLGLACFYRWRFRPYVAVAAGAALSANLLIRPIYLYPTHATSLIVLGLLVRHSLRRRDRPLPAQLRGWAILLLTTQIVLGATLAYSQLRYGDSRLTTGTYGAWPLWLANNEFVPGDRPFLGASAEGYEKRRALFDSGVGWQRRHEILTEETIAFWREHPGTAVRNWLWRMQLFLGFEPKPFKRSAEASGLWQPHLHSSLIALLALLAGRAGFLWRYGKPRHSRLPALGVVAALLFGLFIVLLSGTHPHALRVNAQFHSVIVLLALLVSRGWLLRRSGEPRDSWLAGVVVALLFGLYVAVHSLFVMDSRYVNGTAPLILAAIVFLASEVGQALKSQFASLAASHNDG